MQKSPNLTVLFTKDDYTNWNNVPETNTPSILLNIIISYLAVSIKIVVCKDYRVRYRLIRNGEADMYMRPLSYSYSPNDSIVYYSPPVFTRRVSFIIEKEEAVRKTFSFLSTFDPYVWMIFCFSVVSLPLVIRSWKLSHQSYLQLLKAFAPDFFGGHSSSCDHRIRIIQYFWILGKTVLFLAFSCTVVATMAIPARPPTVDTFRRLGDAVASGTHQCYILATLQNTKTILRQSEDPALRTLGQSLRRKKFSLPMMSSEELGKFVSKKSAYIGLEDYLQFVRVGRQKLILSKDSLKFFNEMYIVRKNSPFKKKIDDLASKLSAAGIPDHLESKNKWQSIIRAQLKLASKNIQNLKEVSITDIQGVIYFYIGGCILSTFVLILEKKYFQSKKLRYRNKQSSL